MTPSDLEISVNTGLREPTFKITTMPTQLGIKLSVHPVARLALTNDQPEETDPCSNILARELS